MKWSQFGIPSIKWYCYWIWSDRHEIVVFISSKASLNSSVVNDLLLNIWTIYLTRDLYYYFEPCIYLDFELILILLLLLWVAFGWLIVVSWFMEDRYEFSYSIFRLLNYWQNLSSVIPLIGWALEIWCSIDYLNTLRNKVNK